MRPVGVHLPCNVRLSLPPSPSHGGEPGSDGTLTRQSRRVSRPSPSMAQIPTPTNARLTKTAPQQCPQSSSPPSPPLPTQWGASLAEHRAATILQCWKWRIWLCRWFDAMARHYRLFPRSLVQRRVRSRSTFASKHCAVAHRPMPARFGEINVLLRPRPKSPPTRRFYAIPSAPVASHYHCGRGANNTKNCVVAQVEGTGPVLPILEGSHRVCP